MNSIWYSVIATDCYGRPYVVSKHDTIDRAKKVALSKLATIGHSYRIEVLELSSETITWRNGKIVP